MNKKIKKQKAYQPVKCDICHEYINNEENLTRWVNENGKKKKGHLECKNNNEDRIKFFKYYCEILNIPKTDKYTVMTCDRWRKDGYSYQVILHALKTKEKAFKAGYEDETKGIAYAMAIIRNHLNFSLKAIEKENKKIQSFNLQEDIIDLSDLKSKEYNTTDYSKILD